ncbi:UNVERIFIED_CONTAM: hypothetical protein FKN15_041089 [Acipenser sinensis]
MKVPPKCHYHQEVDEVVAEAAVLRNPLRCQPLCPYRLLQQLQAYHADHFARDSSTRDSSTKDSESSCIASTLRHSGDWEGWHYLGNYKSWC